MGNRYQGRPRQVLQPALLFAGALCGKTTSTPDRVSRSRSRRLGTQRKHQGSTCTRRTRVAKPEQPEVSDCLRASSQLDQHLPRRSCASQPRPDSSLPPAPGLRAHRHCVEEQLPLVAQVPDNLHCQPLI